MGNENNQNMLKILLAHSVVVPCRVLFFVKCGQSFWCACALSYHQCRNGLVRVQRNRHTIVFLNVAVLVYRKGQWQEGGHHQVHQSTKHRRDGADLTVVTDGRTGDLQQACIFAPQGQKGHVGGCSVKLFHERTAMQEGLKAASCGTSLNPRPPPTF